MNYYNEILDVNGKVKPHYEAAHRIWSRLSFQQRHRLHQQSKRYFAYEYTQDPFPRILKNDEGETLRRGVEQRARAILAFLMDYQAKGKKWRQVMPGYLLRSIIKRHHSENHLLDLKPDQVAFPYGPDIIRDKTGRWRVIEDSAGIIGGVGDVLQSRKVLFKMMPELRGPLRHADDPMHFYCRLASYYRDQARRHGGIPVLYLRDFRFEADQETQRLAALFKSLGVETATSTNRLKKMIVEPEGLFLKHKGTKQKIGALITHCGSEQIQSQNLFYLLEKIRSKKVPIKNLLKTYQSIELVKSLVEGKAWTNFSPGLQFVNDKTFGVHVDTMIRKLLHEEPIIESLPAQNFFVRYANGEWRLDPKVWRKMKDKDRFVVKKVDEDGGAGVWIGSKVSRKNWDILQRNIRLFPEKYILQKFEHLSVLNDRIVDLRLHAHVDQERIIVNNTPWGRANWLKSNGKVNISDNGFLSPVVVLRDHLPQENSS